MEIKLRGIDLLRFYGSETIFKHGFGEIVYTEGVQFLAQKANAYWLIDTIASYQAQKLLINNALLQEFQLWRLEVNENHTAILTCRTDSYCQPIITQNIEFTDFPLKSIKLYLCEKVLMLPSEY